VDLLFLIVSQTWDTVLAFLLDRFLGNRLGR